MIDLATTTRNVLRPEELAESLGKSRRMVYYWIASGKVKTITWDTTGGVRIPINEARRLAGLSCSPYGLA